MENTTLLIVGIGLAVVAILLLVLIVLVQSSRRDTASSVRENVRYLSDSVVENQRSMADM